MLLRIISISAAASALVRAPLVIGLLFSALAIRTTLTEQDTARKCFFALIAELGELVGLKSTTKRGRPS